jgi:hypothetical protein
VACLGALMRFKIGFEFPYFDQKKIQHAHSNFAFVGWVTQTLLVLIVGVIAPFLNTIQLKKYNQLLWVNLFCAYGMLVSFIIQGYGLFSIAFSTISIALIVIFTILFFKQAAQFKQYFQAIKWFKGALVFAIFSALGTVALAYMMVTKNLHQTPYLASVYFYLHFQYNGWFFFACMGLFTGLANKFNVLIKNDKLIFGLLFWSCIPAYFLSTLWAHLPIWLYIIVVAAAITQFVGWILLLKSVFYHLHLESKCSNTMMFLIYFVAIAGFVKFTLQLGSTIPFVSTLAFGFRPIVIAYLHLVLLAFISILLLLYLFSTHLLSHSKSGIIALLCFAICVFLNEFVLAIQGIASFSYTVIPYANTVLFAIALCLMLSAFFLFVINYKTKVDNN